MEDIQQLIQSFAETKSQKIYNDIIESLKTQDKLWIAFSPVTKNYYLDYIQGSPAVFVFSKKEYCELFKDYLLQKNIRIDISEGSIDDRVKLFGDFYRNGFETIVVDNGQNFLNKNLSDIIEKPDFSDIPEGERPVVNPSLMCAANRFFQSLSAKRPTRDMEYNMISEIYKAKYLLPVDKNNSIKDDDIVSITAVIQKDGKKYIPVFTDWNEMAKYDKNKQFIGCVATFDDIEKFCKDGDYVTINPFGFNMTIDNNTVNIIHSVVKNVGQSDNQEKVTIFDVEIYPEKMIKCLNEYFDKSEGVKSAYIRCMRKGDIVGYLIIVDFEGDKNQIFGGISEAIAPYTENKPVDFISYSSEFGKNAVGSIKPFYQKIKIEF